MKPSTEKRDKCDHENQFVPVEMRIAGIDSVVPHNKVRVEERIEGVSEYTEKSTEPSG
jgi:hypothetical protein